MTTNYCVLFKTQWPVALIMFVHIYYCGGKSLGKRSEWQEGKSRTACYSNYVGKEILLANLRKECSMAASAYEKWVVHKVLHPSSWNQKATQRCPCFLLESRTQRRSPLACQRQPHIGVRKGFCVTNGEHISFPSTWFWLHKVRNRIEQVDTYAVTFLTLYWQRSQS